MTTHLFIVYCILVSYVFRAITVVRTGIVSQAKGSAYVEMGKTKVVCSVFDPRETPGKSGYSVQGSLYCEFKFASFSCAKRRIHQQDAEEKEYSLIMQRALEPAVCRVTVESLDEMHTSAIKNLIGLIFLPITARVPELPS